MKAVILLGICFIALFLAWIYSSLNRVDIDASEPGAVCWVHDIPLQEGVVRITYGLRKPTKADEDARRNLFPHANSEYHRGCVVEEAKRARVSFCSECRKAESVWKENKKRIAAPHKSHLEQVRNLIISDPRFKSVYAGIDSKNDFQFEIGGSVETEADLAEFRRLVEATNPPKPINWSVRVSPKKP